MFNNMLTPFFFPLIGAVAGWTYTDYYTTTTGLFLEGDQTIKTVTSTYNIKVIPMGSVTVTFTNISTALASDEYGSLTYPITVTQLFVSPNASVCSANPWDCTSSQTTSSTPTIDTSYYAPLVISAPSSCTKTSFLYTTSQAIRPTSIGDDESTDLVDQATESSEAIFITTYIYTLSTNLGGQAVTTTRCDAYLSDGAVLGLESASEAYYLSQCVDPRRYLCTTTSTVASGACPVTGGVYPPNGQTGGFSGTGSSVATASASSKGGVGGLGVLASQGLRLLVLPLSTLVFSLL